MSEENLIKVKEFIIRERWEYNFDILESTSIQNELKIYGDDAAEILTKFCEEYSLTWDNFNFDSYFKPEPSWIDFFIRKKEYKDFTVGDLVLALKNGHL